MGVWGGGGEKLDRLMYFQPSRFKTALANSVKPIYGFHFYSKLNNCNVGCNVNFLLLTLRHDTGLH